MQLVIYKTSSYIKIFIKRYAEDFEEDEMDDDGNIGNHMNLNREGEGEFEDDEEDILLDGKRAWLYDQAIRGQARQRAATQVEAVLRRYAIFTSSFSYAYVS